MENILIDSRGKFISFLCEQYVCGVIIPDYPHFLFNLIDFFLLGHLKVIDFGLAKWLKRGEKTWTICGTLQYIGELKLIGCII